MVRARPGGLLTAAPLPAPGPAGPAAPAAEGPPEVARHPASLVPAVLVALGGFLVFGLGAHVAGYAVLAAALGAAVVVGRLVGHLALLRDLALVVLGLLIMSLVPVNTEVSDEHMLAMGSAMIAAVVLPYAVSRWVYRDHAVRFPLRAGRWTRFERGWLIAVVVIGYAVLPVYMIRTGVYENWPAARTTEDVLRLFLGTNALGIWDELFFVCTAFTLLRRHLPLWQANLLQAVLFTSFLYELGFEAWGPWLIYPFALIQGWTFSVTRSLTYVVAVHLLFDLVLFAVLLHAHTREWLPIFVY